MRRCGLSIPCAQPLGEAEVGVNKMGLLIVESLGELCTGLHTHSILV